MKNNIQAHFYETKHLYSFHHYTLTKDLSYPHYLIFYSYSMVDRPDDKLQNELHFRQSKHDTW